MMPALSLPPALLVQVRALLEELYGITDLDQVACDPWSVHADPVGGSARCIQAFLYARTRYAHGWFGCGRPAAFLRCLGFPVPIASGSRRTGARCRCRARSPDDNAYAHPLDLVPMVDLNTGKIVRIDRPLTKDGKVRPWGW